MNPLLLETLSLCCPRCGDTLAWEEKNLVCGQHHLYPVRFGIPDFRIAPDPYISISDEVAKVEKMTGAGERSFEELIARYYELTPEVPPVLQARYRQGLLAGEARGSHLLQWMEQHLGTLDSPLLDVGCGTAGLMLAAHRRGTTSVGVDVALRWLVIGKQRLREAGCDGLLFCANAEALPFANALFRAVASDSTLEHVSDVPRTVQEAVRVCQPDGAVAFQTVNEQSIMDPYTGFPLPGLVPAKVRNRVISRLRRTPYLATPPTSSALREIQRVHPFLSVSAYVPELEHHATRGHLLRGLTQFYAGLARSRIGNAILRRLGLFTCIYGRVSGKAAL